MRIPPARAMILAAAAALSAFAVSAQEVTLTYSGGGGRTQEIARSVWLNPAAEIGLKFKEDTLVGIADVRAQVKAGAPSWDIVVLGAHDCVQGSNEGLFEALDFSVIKADQFPKQIVGTDWVGAYYYSNVLGWNTKSVGKKVPASWADLWDIKAFPGTRGLRNRPIATLEVALLADGVPMDKLYPLDVARAFRSLEKIKPEVSVWWASGAQQIQLLRDGEVDYSVAWTARIGAAIQDGAPLAYSWNQGLLVADCFAVLKGTKHKEAAIKAIAYFLDGVRQANFSKQLDLGPVNPAAYEGGILSDADKARLPSSPERMKQQIVVDYAWWGANGAKMQELYDMFLASKSKP